MNTSIASLKTAWAPAKVNLYLHVGKPLEDGRHPLDSLVQFTDSKAADRISARSARDLSLSLEGPGAKALKGEKNNLVLHAAHLLRKAAGRTDLGAVLHLHKELPIAAGVGGGSADAAATLVVLNKYWDIGFSESALESIAAQLGADVPASLTGQPSLMRGTGETLSPVDLIDLPIVLINPGIKLSTEAVFKRFDKLEFGGSFELVDPPAPQSADPVSFAKALSQYSNDLEGPAMSLCGAIGDVLGALEAHGAHLSRMSGSGATCFGIFSTQDEASAAAYSLSKKHRKWWVRSTCLLGSGRS